MPRTVGRRIPGFEGTAATTGIAATLYPPVGTAIFIQNPPDTSAVFYAAGAGILASVVPHVADLVALRRVPASLCGILTSVNPIFAAIIGAIALRQALWGLGMGGNCPDRWRERRRSGAEGFFHARDSVRPIQSTSNSHFGSPWQVLGGPLKKVFPHPIVSCTMAHMM
ncbi:EamA family transporter [Pseudarthrobacter sp. S9]|uniref:EamA family transporter n=1 Tax=Pseudarthrobacter sp. S9 TaxID=3418421 RepID=UPI003D02DBDF